MAYNLVEPIFCLYLCGNTWQYHPRVLTKEMKLSFSRPQRPHTIYILKSFRDKDGKSTSKRVKTLGSEEEIEAKYGCSDGLEWAKAYVAKLNEEERRGNEKVCIELSPNKPVEESAQKLVSGGDIFLLPLYNRLGLPQACKEISNGSKIKYNLEEIMQALVVLRVLYPCSKRSTLALNQNRIKKATIEIENIYRALSLLSAHIDYIQATVWENSKKIIDRDTRVVYYDCTNYYFEIEDNDLKYDAPKKPKRRVGIRQRGKSKEHRPNPIVQMGLLMDADGIPLAFTIFPGNESEQPSLQRIEEMVAEQFGLTEFVISTDAGLSSEDNRRYNMTEGLDYIAVQSLPKLSEADQAMALDPRGWRIAFRDKSLRPIDPENPERDIFNLEEINFAIERNTKFYKEIIVNKYINGKKSTARPERVIVTYSYEFAQYLRHKREERLACAEKIVKKKESKSRQSQQDPRRYVSTTYVTADGEVAERIHMAIDYNAIEAEERFDGFYAYATSLDDDALVVLRARSFHHEIEHLFRTTKSFLDARPVYLQREDRIRSHFLICFLAMTILKILQKQLGMSQVSIEQLISTLRDIKFAHFNGLGYAPMFTRNALVDRLQELAGVRVDTEIVPQKTMNKLYRSVNAG